MVAVEECVDCGAEVTIPIEMATGAPIRCRWCAEAGAPDSDE